MGQGQILHILVLPKVAKVGLFFKWSMSIDNILIWYPDWQLCHSYHLFFKPSMYASEN